MQTKDCQISPPTFSCNWSKTQGLTIACSSLWYSPSCHLFDRIPRIQNLRIALGLLRFCLTYRYAMIIVSVSELLSKLAIFEKHTHILVFNCEPVNDDNVCDTINLWSVMWCNVTSASYCQPSLKLRRYSIWARNTAPSGDGVIS